MTSNNNSVGIIGKTAENPPNPAKESNLHNVFIKRFCNNINTVIKNCIVVSEMNKLPTGTIQIFDFLHFSFTIDLLQQKWLVIKVKSKLCSSVFNESVIEVWQSANS